MQKSKIFTYVTIATILFYGLFANLKLVRNINILYLYIINPIFWIGLAIFLYFALGKSLEKRRLKKQITQYTIIAALTYIIIYMLSGLIITFGDNPYNTSIKGLMHNLWTIGTIIVAKEYIRYKLINNVNNKDKISISIIISIVYVIIDIDISGLIGKLPITVIRYFFQTTLPLVVKNIVFSYIAIYYSYKTAVIYEMLTNLYFWISPIIPNSPWVMTAIIDSSIPMILFLYVRFFKNKQDFFRTRDNIENSNPRNIIPLVCVTILAIWFALGIFPIKPISIASGSMEKELSIGDIAIIKKCNANDINVGDIIEYQMEEYTVVHRVIEKKQKNGSFSFVTKGDNNSSPDKDEVTESQLIGKVIFKIKYLGYPSIWLTNLEKEEKQLEIETGN